MFGGAFAAHRFDNPPGLLQTFGREPGGASQVWRPMSARRRFWWLLGLLLILNSAALAKTKPPRRAAGITAKAAILVDNRTGVVLWERNADLPLPPASTTKVVTAMVALQSGRLDDSLLVTPTAAQAPPSKKIGRAHV